MNTTTRRHPRTLQAAFPKDYAGWISHHKRPITERIADVVLATIIGSALAAVLVHWIAS